MVKRAGGLTNFLKLNKKHLTIVFKFIYYKAVFYTVIIVFEQYKVLIFIKFAPP